MTYNKPNKPYPIIASSALLLISSVAIAGQPQSLSTPLLGALNHSHVKSSAQMLANGDFTKGLAHWKIEESGATGKSEITHEGPGKTTALRLQVVTVADATWKLQICHPEVAMSKAKRYSLEFWGKSLHDSVITVNCMMNHAPWEHHGAATELKLTNTWKKLRYDFDGPWDDTNARVTFTNLATAPGQIYWFAKCSLREIKKVKTAELKPSFKHGKRIVVWDGERVNVGSGWTNPTSSTILRAKGDAHSGDTAMEFKFKTNHIWVGAGWDWFQWKTGTNVGTDTRGMKNLSFWIKSKGTTGDLQVPLLCNGDVLDTPEHHTAKVVVAKYTPNFRDGNWHQVVIPLEDLTQPTGYDPKIVSQIDFGFMAESEVDGSFLVDDITFDGGF